MIKTPFIVIISLDNS